MKRLHSRVYASALATCLAVAGFLARPEAVDSSSTREGGVVRVAYRGADIDSLDPALAYTIAAGLLIDPTCAPLLRSGGKGGQLQPEVATGMPRVTDGGKTYTFTVQRGFRFSDGTPVEATAFARAIARTLVPSMRSPFATYMRDIVGAEDALAGRTTTPAGVIAHGRTLVIRLEHAVPDFPARLTFLCAVPPTLPADPEGIAAFHAAGPYYIAEYRPH